jgi:hypothetical protein
MPVMNYLLPLDIVTAALCIAVPVLCLVRRWCSVPFQAAAAIVVLLLLFLALPTAFKGTYDLDTRFIVMLASIVPAALVPIALPRRAGRTIGIGFLLLFGVRMAVLMFVWHNWSGGLAAFRTVIASVQPGSVVLTVRQPRGEEPNIWTSVASARRLSDGTVVDAHLPALLLIEHRAFWPYLFDNVSQQPIRTREPYRAAASLVDNATDPIALLANDAPEMRVFTHVLILGRKPKIPTEDLKLVAENSEAALFEITRPRSPPPDR